MIKISKIISGGQTGADRGGLNAAIKLGIPHGGYCPSGRRAEDGRVPHEYNLIETGSLEYPVRTLANIRASDGTIVFTQGAAEAGSALTIHKCQGEGKPVLHLNLASPGIIGLVNDETNIQVIRDWLTYHLPDTGKGILNIAGNRESKAPGIQKKVEELLIKVFSDDEPERIDLEKLSP